LYSQANIDRITALVNRFRKIELKNWPAILTATEEDHAISASLWWAKARYSHILPSLSPSLHDDLPACAAALQLAARLSNL
jgi:hypothetical protein